MPCAIVALALTAAMPVAVVRAANEAGANPITARFQYDALEIAVPAGQIPDGPDSFGRHYTQALEYFARSESLSAQRADVVAKREAAMRTMRGAGAGEKILGVLSGQVSRLLSQANPVAGMVFGMVMGAARKGQADEAARAEAAAEDAEEGLRREESRRPRLRRVSVWDRWLRVDDLDDGSAVVYKPDVGEYLVLDTRQKTWVRLDTAPAHDEVIARIANDPNRCNYVPDRVATPLVARRIDGHDVAGYREVERVPGSDPQSPAMVMEFTYYFADQRIPDPILALLNGLPPCPPDSPAARGTSVPDDRVTLYQSLVTRWEGTSGQPVAAGAGEDDRLGFEQHLRTLDERDRDAFFNVPADYRQLR